MIDWPVDPLPPIAVRDTALLPPGGEVTINPLANDTDPGGGVLVVTAATVGAKSSLKVGVVDRKLLRISSSRELERPEIIYYVVSNGAASSRGVVLVTPTPASAGQRPPTVQDIEVSVRTGGIVTIPVMDFASDPDGDDLFLERDLVEQVSSGLLFVSGDRLRFQAPATPTTARAVFAISDSAGNVTSASLTVNVHASDASQKQPAKPRDIEARVFAGETVRIPVPLLGIDDDGDGVALLGEATAPTKGRIVAVGADYLEYEAFPTELGTDTFTYAVEDWVGQRSIASIRVGIAKRPTEALPIIARDDEVTVQPGELVEVRVLVNDDNPSGGDLVIDPLLEVPQGLEAYVSGRRIVVQTPRKEGPIQIVYRVSNDRGAQASAVLTVNVVKDAEIAAPIAGDVVVPAIDTLNKTAVEVDVLAVAENPSGPLSDLAASIPRSHAQVASVTGGNKVLVLLGATAQTIPYLLTNTNAQAKGVSTYAFITVPALGDFPPVLRPKTRALRVASGAELVFGLEEFVQVGPGKSAQITDADKVTATKSDGSVLLVDARTLRFVSTKGYAGPASITFEVTDGASRTDPEGRRKTLTLPITVYATESFPPQFAPSVVEAPQGEGAVAVDLRRMTIGPEGQTEGEAQYTYRLTSAAPGGFTVSLDGSILQISAAAATTRGTVGSVGITIDYGGTVPLEGRVEFRAIASTRQVARVNDVVVTDGVSGVERTVGVLAGAFNPYPGAALKVVDATVETPGSGTASVATGAVVLRPVEGFIGQMVVRFRVADLTGEPSREVEARVRLDVRAAPDAPGAPRLNSVRDATVVLSWDAPANNAAVITGYEVTQSPGGTVTTCPATTCTIAGLTNDTEYTFAVRARNAVGWSPFGPASAVARPDQVPEPPAAPTVEFGDGELSGTWPVPASPGSPVSTYTVQISPAPVNGPATVTTSTPNVVFRGLANGTGYTMRVKAHNRADGDSGWGATSRVEVPAGVPGAPAVTAARVETALGKQITVGWDLPARNGADIEGFVLTITGGGTNITAKRDASDRGYSFTDAKNGVEYTFSVVARNKAGTSSAGTATSKTWGTPTKPTALSAKDAAIDGTVFNNGKVDFAWASPSDSGGLDIARYEFGDPNVGGGSAVSLGLATTQRVKKLVGGSPAGGYKVRACNAKDVCGDWAAFSSATPTTVPAAPTISADPQTWDRFTYTVTRPTDSGGSSITEWDVCITPQDGPKRCGEPEKNTSSPGAKGEGTTTVSARYKNARGWSDTKTVTVEVQRPSAPDAPAVTATGGVEKVTFSWTAPASNGRPITSYEWRVSQGGVALDASRPTVTGPNANGPIEKEISTPGDVVVEVRAVNEIDRGPWTKQTAFVSPVPMPAAPAVKLDRSSTAETATFEATGSAPSGKTIKKFKYRVFRDGVQVDAKVVAGSKLDATTAAAPGASKADLRVEVYFSVYADAPVDRDAAWSKMGTDSIEIPPRPDPDPDPNPAARVGPAVP